MKTQIDICANNLLNYKEKFKALYDEYRLDILNILSKNGETCVCDLSELLELSQSRLSYHLKILLDADFISVEQEGKWNYYSANPKEIKEILSEDLYFKLYSIDKYFLFSKSIFLI